MIELSESTIDTSCKLVRKYFPSSLIIQTTKDITEDYLLTIFPLLKTEEDKILKTKKRDYKISLDSLNELNNYFYERQNLFLDFLKRLTSQSIKNQVIPRIVLDDFILDVNIVLFNDSKIKIENYELIQKLVPNKANKEIFLNIDVPEYIQDYFIEALDCFAHNLHRSSILFCTISLEAALKYKYLNMEKNPKQKIRFVDLIKWGIQNNLIEENGFNEISIDFIRKYRNDLAHCNTDDAQSMKQISREYANKMSKIIIQLSELSINNIFYT